MTEKQYVGIDLHRRRSVIVRRNDAGETLEVTKVNNDDLNTFEQAVMAAGEHPDAVVEASYSWYWAADWLESIGAEVHLAHPLGNNWGHRRVKNKHGYGFHPLGSWCDTTSEPLAAMLRPGNAGSNTADDHLELLDRTIAVLPPEYRLGHEPGDDPSFVVHPILVRADAAGATHGFVDGLVEANIGFSIGHPVDDNVRSGLFIAQEEDWVPAVELDGTRRPGAFVIELTDLVDLSSWPEGTRLICRREHPHPGAQLSLFDRSEGEWRHTCFITDRTGNDVAVLELGHRGHARVEDRVRCWKDTGLKNLPFEGYVRNEAWLAVSLVAGALLSWSQMTCFTGKLQKAEPKTLRYRVLHVAAVLVRRGRDMILRLDRDWPWKNDLAEAYARLRAALP